MECVIKWSSKRNGTIYRTRIKTHSNGHGYAQ